MRKKQFAQIAQKNAPVQLHTQSRVQDAEHRAEPYAVVRADRFAERCAVTFAGRIAMMQKTVQFFVQKTQIQMKVRIISRIIYTDQSVNVVPKQGIIVQKPKIASKEKHRLTKTMFYLPNNASFRKIFVLND